MKAQGQAEDLSDCLARIERGIRILENKLHLGAQRAEFAPGQVRDVTPAEKNLPLAWFMKT